MTNEITVLGFDADDTLWSDMPFYTEAERQFRSLLSRYADPETVSREHYQTEIANIPLYGFGGKSAALSMIETAMRLGGGTLPTAVITDIIAIGKRYMDHPVQVLDGVVDVLEALRGRYTLIVATKGDLVDQERKLEKSGLKPYFHHIEIMSDKTPDKYAQMLRRLGVRAEQFLMTGNSVKSDIEPILSLGGYAVHVPFHDTWIHEKAEPPREHERFFGIESIRDLIELPLFRNRMKGTL
jgi:putative hydrolase of the HAD superfamily